MSSLKLFKDGLTIFRKFGFIHALKRSLDLLFINIEDQRRTFLYKKTKPKGTIVKQIHGQKMELNMDDFGIHRDLFLFKEREPVATEHIKSILGKEDVVLEIGANIGYYALIEAKLCKKVYAVEPDSRNIKYLKRNIDLNKHLNVDIFEMALGDHSGTSIMNLAEKVNLNSFYPVENIIGQKEIKMDTADNFLNGKLKPSLVRMDVEGYELNVIRGMKETLRHVNRLFIEIHSQIMTQSETNELLDIMDKSGFYTEMIIKYDKPGFSRVLPSTHLDFIRNGDKGVYEVFFSK